MRGIDLKFERNVSVLGRTNSVKEGELEPDLEKALSNPKIKDAIASQISEAESARQTYSNAVNVANDFARASFIEHFPEIAGLPLPQWEGALAAMAQRERDPAKALDQSVGRRALGAPPRAVPGY